MLADVGEFAGGQVIPTKSSHNLRAEGVTLVKEGRTRLILANLSAGPQQVTVHNLGEQVRVHLLDETNAETAMQSPDEFRRQPGEMRQTEEGVLQLSLRPYAVARIDVSD